MMKARPYIICFAWGILLGCLPLLTGCQQVEDAIEAEEQASTWLNGKWKFDEKFTQKHWKKMQEQHDRRESGLEYIYDTAKHWGERMVAPWVLSGEKDVSITFDGVQRIVTTDGKGKASPYVITHAKNGNEATLEFTNGDVVTYMLVDGHLRVPFDGVYGNFVFFRKVD